MYVDFDHKVFGTYTVVKDLSLLFLKDMYGQSISNPLIRGLWSLSIGNVGSRERLESAFNKKHLLIINLEPQLHGLLLQLIWYVGSREKFESTFFKITYE